MIQKITVLAVIILLFPFLLKLSFYIFVIVALLIALTFLALHLFRDKIHNYIYAMVTGNKSFRNGNLHYTDQSDYYSETNYRTSQKTQTTAQKNEDIIIDVKAQRK